MTDSFAQTESLLRAYWRRKVEIESLRDVVRGLEGQLDTLQEQLHSVRQIPSQTTRYGPTVQGRGEGDPGLDNLLAQWEQQTERLREQIIKAHKRLIDERMRLYGLIEDQTALMCIIGQLNQEEKRILECRYIYRWSNYQIGADLNYSEATIRRRYSDTVSKVDEWLEKRDAKPTQQAL